MPKRLVVALLVLVALIAVGIVELTVLSNGYGQLYDAVEGLAPQVLDGTVDIDEYDSMTEHWVTVRTISELCLPHNDIWEINARIAECRANILAGQYEQAYANMAVLLELMRYIPQHSMPTLGHIL